MVAELSHLNLYNVLEECHHKPHPAEAAAAGAGQEEVARIDDAASVGQLRRVQQQRLVQVSCAAVGCVVFPLLHGVWER